MNYYFYAKNTDAQTVFKVAHAPVGIADDMAKAKARKMKMELAGGYFSEQAKPYDFDKLTVIKVYKNTKPFVYKPDNRLQKSVVEWDEVDIMDEEIEYRKLQADEDFTNGLITEIPEEEQIRDEVAQDQDFWQEAHSIICEQLTDFMKERNKKSDGVYWNVTGKNMGWLKQEGQKYIKAETGKELLSQILPKTDCTWRAYRHRNGIALKNYHHDAPTGEWYILTGIKESFYNQENY